ncbi:MAG: hypothetical protein ACTHMS_12330 [Jatrophihabitans sp.]|uniref:hypothetical protein n=1 Tax=Jatrophihabitans sp. TaxID=1932789 RepID=UPI003F8093CF
MTEDDWWVLAMDTSDLEASDLAYRLLSARDVARNRAKAAAFQSRIDALTTAQRRHRVDLFIRCDLNCLLVEIFLEKLAEGGQWVFLSAHTRRGAKMYYANGGAANDAYDADMWAPIACRHGSGRYVLADALELVWLSDLEHGSSLRLSDTVTVTTASSEGPRSHELPVLGAPYGRWNPR